jgi:ribosomal protein L37AE/L43A
MMKATGREAIQMDEQVMKGKPAKRVCLKCGEKFPSRGPANRICKKCTRINAGYGSIPEAVLAMQRGAKRHNGFIIDSTADFLPE